MDTRETALLLFVEMEKTKNFGSSLIRDTLNKYDYENPREKAFLKRLAEGTLESLLTLDYVINAYSKTPTNKMKPLIRSCLLYTSLPVKEEIWKKKLRRSCMTPEKL